jgi:hypothetical protein
MYSQREDAGIRTALAFVNPSERCPGDVCLVGPDRAGRSLPDVIGRFCQDLFDEI